MKIRKIPPLLDDEGHPIARVADLKGELHVSFPIGYRSYMKAEQIHKWLGDALGIASPTSAATEGTET